MYTNIFLRALTVFFIRKTDLLICSTMLIEKGMRLWLSKKHQLRTSYKTIKQGQPWQTTSPMPCFVQCYQHNTLSLIDDGTGARYVRCSILTTTQSVCPSIGARMFQASKPPTNSFNASSSLPSSSFSASIRSARPLYLAKSPARLALLTFASVSLSLRTWFSAVSRSILVACWGKLRYSTTTTSWCSSIMALTSSSGIRISSGSGTCALRCQSPFQSVGTTSRWLITWAGSYVLINGDKGTFCFASVWTSVNELHSENRLGWDALVFRRACLLGCCAACCWIFSTPSPPPPFVLAALWTWKPTVLLVFRDLLGVSSISSISEPSESGIIVRRRRGFRTVDIASIAR